MGDIHGRLDLLENLYQQIIHDAKGFSGRVILIYLGDFIDRGEHSKQVIDFLMTVQQPQEAFESIYLRGNHEQILLDFLHDENVARSWLLFGGKEMLASYDIHIQRIPIKKNDLISLQQRLLDSLPDSHYQFIKNTQFFYTMGSYFFVHAGVNPKKRLNKQKHNDFLWIRESFIDYPKPFEKIIVHGHTIAETVQLLPNRIGVDTGAYESGVLSCLVLQADQQRVIHT